MPETPNEILRALADPERLAIAGRLARSSATAVTLVEELGIPIERLRRHLTRLTTTGVARLEPDRRTYRLDPETLRWAAEQVGPPRDTGLALGAASEDEETVLRAFFREGRLVEIPAKESKRRIVLERIALEFEPGVRYDERTVNAIIGRFFPDHAAIRRYLVDEGFLERERGEYWRTGGRVEVEPPAERPSGRRLASAEPLDEDRAGRRTAIGSPPSVRGAAGRGPCRPPPP